jgi:hypothetical protein
MGVSQIFSNQFKRPFDISLTASNEDPLGNFVNKEMSEPNLTVGKGAKNKEKLKKSGKTRKTLGLLNQSSAGTRSDIGNAIISGQ